MSDVSDTVFRFCHGSKLDRDNIRDSGYVAQRAKVREFCKILEKLSALAQLIFTMGITFNILHMMSG